MADAPNYKAGHKATQIYFRMIHNPSSVARFWRFSRTATKGLDLNKYSGVTIHTDGSLRPLVAESCAASNRSDGFIAVRALRPFAFLAQAVPSTVWDFFGRFDLTADDPKQNTTQF